MKAKHGSLGHINHRLTGPPHPAATGPGSEQVCLFVLSAPFCAFWPFCEFAFLRLSAIRNGSSGSSHHELNGMVRPVPNNPIRRVAECAKLLHMIPLIMCKCRPMIPLKSLKCCGNDPIRNRTAHHKLVYSPTVRFSSDWGITWPYLPYHTSPTSPILPPLPPSYPIPPHPVTDHPTHIFLRPVLVQDAIMWSRSGHPY